MEELSGSTTTAPDPMEKAMVMRQPNARITAFHKQMIDDMISELGL